MFVQSAHIPEIIPVYARSPKGEPLEMVLVEWHKKSCFSSAKSLNGRHY